MKRTARRARSATASGAAVGALLLLVAAAGASPAAVDLHVDIAVGSSLGDARPVPDGGTRAVAGLAFWAGPGVELITPQTASARVRFELPDGLRWGRDEPDPSEQCASTPTTGTCLAQLEPITGRTGIGWAWEVIAARAGSYVLRAEIVEASDSDPEPSNDSTSVSVVVGQAPPPAGGGARVGAARLSPARPKAGQTVVASVRMTAGGNPVRPSGVSCAGSAGATRLKGVGRAGSGSATCAYRTPKSAKRKLLRGAVTFTAAGARYTRRFSARLG